MIWLIVSQCLANFDGCKDDNIRKPPRFGKRMESENYGMIRVKEAQPCFKRSDIPPNSYDEEVGNIRQKINRFWRLLLIPRIESGFENELQTK